MCTTYSLCSVVAQENKEDEQPKTGEENEQGQQHIREHTHTHTHTQTHTHTDIHTHTQIYVLSFTVKSVSSKFVFFQAPSLSNLILASIQLS